MGKTATNLANFTNLAVLNGVYELRDASPSTFVTYDDAV
jgi:hypothetical protein